MGILISKVKCLFLKHEEFTAISFKTGQSETYCKRCGKKFNCRK